MAKTIVTPYVKGAQCTVNPAHGNDRYRNGNCAECQKASNRKYSAERERKLRSRTNPDRVLLNNPMNFNHRVVVLGNKSSTENLMTRPVWRKKVAI